MVRKKNGKGFEDENIQWITVQGGNINWKKIYIGKNIYWKKINIGKKKEKANLVIPIEKIKRHTIG